MESWKPVVLENFLNDPFLEVSDSGKIRRTDGERVRASNGPYVLVKTRNWEGMETIHNLHRLVAMLHIGPPPFEGAVARHKDGKGRLGWNSDNSVSNLEWGSLGDNAEDARRHGTMAIGSKQGLSKLTEAEVAEIKQMLLDGAAPIEIAERFGVTPSPISAILWDKTWVHVPWPPGSQGRVAILRAKHAQKLNPEKANEIRQRVAAGEKWTHLAKEFGCSRGAIQDVVRGQSYVDAGPTVEEWAVRLGKPKPGIRFIRGEVLSKVVAELDKGRSPTDVGTELGYTRQAVYQAYVRTTGKSPPYARKKPWDQRKMRDED